MRLALPWSTPCREKDLQPHQGGDVLRPCVGLISTSQKEFLNTSGASYLEHLGEISQIERVVALSGCRQKVVGDRVVDVERSRHHVCRNLSFREHEGHKQLKKR